MPSADAAVEGHRAVAPGVRARGLPRFALLLVLSSGSLTAAASDCAELVWEGTGIPEPLNGAVGDALRGRALAADPEGGNCTLCHALPLPEPEFHGNVGPDLHDAGTRLTPAQLRARIAAPRRLNPHTVMPAYCTTGNRWRAARAVIGEPLLTAGEIEDLVAWLATLSEPTEPGIDARPPAGADSASGVERSGTPPG